MWARFCDVFKKIRQGSAFKATKGQLILRSMVDLFPGCGYVVRCKPHHERIVVKHLERVGIVAFCPEIKDEQIKPDIHRIFTFSPLFRGYLFAEFEWTMDFRPVTYGRGVRRVVMFGTTPAIVKQDQIDAIRARISSGYVPLIPRAFTRGQVVSVKDGLLRGIEAVLKELCPGVSRRSCCYGRYPIGQIWL